MSNRSSMPYSTSNKIMVDRGKGKEKMPIDSPETIRLLEDCCIKASDVKYMNGVPLVNAWSTFVNGEKTIFCYSVTTSDGRYHVRDYKGNVTSPMKRDATIDALLDQFLNQSIPRGVIESESNKTCSAATYLPNNRDIESAYRMLTSMGESVSIDAVLGQIEINTKNNGQSLRIDWRKITEKAIENWSIN